MISLVISPMTDATGRITSVSTIARDITSRKKAEASLRDERDRAQQYLDTREVILLKLDVEGRILLVNRYACAVLGWTADELLGRDWIETCLPSRIRDGVRTKLRDLLRRRSVHCREPYPHQVRRGTPRSSGAPALSAR